MSSSLILVPLILFQKEEWSAFLRCFLPFSLISTCWFQACRRWRADGQVKLSLSGTITLSTPLDWQLCFPGIILSRFIADRIYSSSLNMGSLSCFLAFIHVFLLPGVPSAHQDLSLSERANSNAISSQSLLLPLRPSSLSTQHIVSVWSILAEWVNGWKKQQSIHCFCCFSWH